LTLSGAIVLVGRHSQGLSTNKVKTKFAANGANGGEKERDKCPMEAKTERRWCVGVGRKD